MKKILLTAIIIIGAIFGYYQLSDNGISLGGDTQKFIGGSTYTLAGSGVSSTDNSITLNSLTLPQNDYPIQDSDVSDTFYMTIEPGNTSRQEFISCTTIGANTGSNVTISGCTRGLSPIAPYTASTTLRFSHAGASKIIFSNAPQLYDQATFKGNDETITGLWNFTGQVPEISTQATTSNQIVNKALLDATTNQGAATSTESNGGIVELATALEAASSTANVGGTKPLVLQTKYATDTPSQSTVSATKVVMSDLTGYIKQGWINLTQAFTVSGAWTFNTATTTFNAGVDITNNSLATSPLRINGISYLFPSTQGASSTVVTTNGSGGLIFDTVNNLHTSESFVGATTTSTSVDNNDAETTYDSTGTITLPAGSMGTKGTLKLRATISDHDWVASATANNDIAFRFKLGGSTVCTNTFTNRAAAGADNEGYVECIITANNSASSQYYQGVAITHANATDTGRADVTAGTASIDTTTAQQITFTIDWVAANGGNTITISSLTAILQ